MKNVTMASGQALTREKFIELTSGGLDRLTEFLATASDVKLLGQALVREMVGLEGFLAHGRSTNTSRDHAYVTERLERIIDFMPELADEINEMVRLVRIKNDVDLGECSLPLDPGCPKCFSPLERQLAVIDNLDCAICSTADGKLEIGELQKS